MKNLNELFHKRKMDFTRRFRIEVCWPDGSFPYYFGSNKTRLYDLIMVMNWGGNENVKSLQK